VAEPPYVEVTVTGWPLRVPHSATFCRRIYRFPRRGIGAFTRQPGTVTKSAAAGAAEDVADTPRSASRALYTAPRILRARLRPRKVLQLLVQWGKMACNR
jgi:hypothetical protein